MEVSKHHLPQADSDQESEGKGQLGHQEGKGVLEVPRGCAEVQREDEQGRGEAKGERTVGGSEAEAERKVARVFQAKVGEVDAENVLGFGCCGIAE